MLGFKIGVATESLFYHEYEFSRNTTKMYLMERNRYAVLFMYYRLRTLILLLPAFVVTELGLIFFAAKKGWLKQKIKVYWYWLSPRSWLFWLTKRKTIQVLRTVTDRELLKTAVGEIIFDDPAINNFLVQSVGNPVLSLYWKAVKKILFW
jgi:hypothetical protein